MDCMFKGCSSLLSLPDISKWNTNNITDMNSMFKRCSSLSSLSSLPDISKWNTNNVEDISEIFSGCSNIILSKIIKKYLNKN